jgi:hypothetical protein
VDYEDDPRELLTVKYQADVDGTGKLYVRAASKGFAGCSTAWFNTAELVEFASFLSAYPLPEDGNLTISSGFGANERTGEAAREHVSLTVGLVGRKGQVGVRVHLATPVWPDMRPGQAFDVHLELLTTYERLRKFSGHMLGVLRGDYEEATLGAEVLI